MTQAQVEALELADRFEGLPPKFTHFHLCDALTAAQVPLGLKADDLLLLTYLIKHTKALDWQRGSVPIVAWSRFLVMHDLGWSEDKLRRIEKRLLSLKLIAFRDSPTCKRYVKRDESGNITENSFGISLAPVGARASEIRAKAYEHKEYGKNLYDAFTSCFKLRAKIREAISSKELPEQAKEKARELLEKIPARRTTQENLSELKQLYEKARKMLKTLYVVMGIKNPETLIDALMSDEATATQATNTATKDPQEAPKPRAANTPPQPRKFAGHKEPESNNHIFDSNLVNILAASPDIFKSYLEAEQRHSSRLEDTLQRTIERYSSDLDVQPRHAVRLLRKHGPSSTLKALFAMGKVVEKGREISNPGGYITKLVRDVNITSQRRAYH
jgi:DNA repair exonuclease SbcCD ATPase subunit